MHSSVAIYSIHSEHLHEAVRSSKATRPFDAIPLSVYPHAPWWDFPHSEVATRLLCCWDFLHSKDDVYTSRWWDFSHSKALMQISLRALSWPSYGSWNPPLLDLPLSESRNLLQGIFPLRDPVWCSVDEIFPTRIINTNLWAPLIWTYKQMNPW